MWKLSSPAGKTWDSTPTSAIPARREQRSAAARKVMRSSTPAFAANLTLTVPPKGTRERLSASRRC